MKILEESSIQLLLLACVGDMEKLQFAKIYCRCGHVTLIPVYEVFHVFEPVKCEKCGRLVAETIQAQKP